MRYSFDGDIASVVGVNAALIYECICFWLIINKNNHRNEIENKNWVYMSVENFTEKLPFLSKSQVRTALDKLLKIGILVRDNYNRLSYDKTSWYTVSDELWNKITSPKGSGRSPIRRK